MSNGNIGVLSILASQLAQAKQEEEAARSARVAIEGQIAALVETPEKGQRTVTVEGGVRITVKRDLNYKADCKAIFAALEKSPTPPPIKHAMELDVKGYEWIRKHDPDAFAAISRHVEVKPAKVSVSIRGEA